jgi:hypothetical protein
MTADLPAGIRPLALALRDGLRAALGTQLSSLILHGAVAFPESGATGDIDYTALLTEPLAPAENAALHRRHAALARDYPPLGAGLDGYYLLLADALRPGLPPDQLRPGLSDGSWALHRAHILAGRCIVLHGPDPRDYLPAPAWPELAAALEGEMEYVKRVLDVYPHYCILNLCRLIYSHATRDVVISKRAAGAWARERFPRWRPAIDGAARVYDGTATEQDRALLGATVRSFCEFAGERILAG